MWVSFAFTSLTLLTNNPVVVTIEPRCLPCFQLVLRERIKRKDANIANCSPNSNSYLLSVASAYVSQYLLLLQMAYEGVRGIGKDQ